MVSEKSKNNTPQNKIQGIFQIVGKVVLIGIFAYFIFTFFAVKNKETVKFYEVTEGGLVKENNYTGIILRNEELLTADRSGYIYFLVNEGKKIPKNGCIYCIDEHGQLSSYLENGENSSFDQSKLNKLHKDIISESGNLNDTRFSGVYNTYNELSSKIFNYAGSGSLSMLNESISGSGISISRYYSDKTGTAAFFADGLEDITDSELTLDMFDKANYSKTEIKSGDLISAGDSAFKLITDEEWQLAFPINEEELSYYSDKSILKVSFKENDLTTTADFKILKGADGNNFGVLDFSDFLAQFAKDRFVDFEVVTNDVSGLKIPDKAITQKDFYIIPERFLNTDENGNKGFYKLTLGDGADSTVFVIPDIYSIEDEYCFIDTGNEDVLTKGDYICSSPLAIEDRYQIAQLRGLEGVFNINKGYAVFKKIEKLESANEYTIIKKNTPYGLNVYDHIVLDASKVSDGELLYR